MKTNVLFLKAWDSFKIGNNKYDVVESPSFRFLDELGNKRVWVSCKRGNQSVNIPFKITHNVELMK